jgi:glycosyltransferase involved in cell wall biosynthesis
MRIVIDMQVIQVANRNDGLGRYCFLLIQEIIRNRGQHEVFLVLNGLLSNSIETIRTAFHDLLPQENIRVWEPNPVGSNLRAGYNWGRRSQELVREEFLSSLSPDIVLIGSLFEGETNDAIVSIGKLNLATLTATIICELVPLAHRQHCFENAATEVWYENRLDHLRRADLLLTISESSKRDCSQLLGFDANSVVNISPATDSRFCPRSSDADEEKRIRLRYGVVKPFALCLGFKCAGEVIRAFAALPISIRQSHQLLIAAHTPQEERKKLQKTAKECGLKPFECVISYDVLDSDLPVILGLCKVFVASDWEEGFGLTTLEAMACGKAVICADYSYHREIIGCEDALFEPWDVAKISDRLLHVLTENDFRIKLERHGLERAAEFSFNNSAIKALSALEKCYANRLSEPANKNIPLLRRPKMAFVSPLPPEHTGIADYSAELLPELARYYDIDVIVKQEDISDIWVHANCQVHDSEWLMTHADNYDRVLYHIGNSPYHRHMFSLMDKVPGVVVLHDFYLAHVIAGMDTSGMAPGIFAAELHKSHGYLAAQERYKFDIEDVMQQYPCNLSILQKSIGIIVHSEVSLRMARDWYGDSASENMSAIPLLKIPAFGFDRLNARKILNLDEETFIVCSFGAMGPSKLNHRLLDAWLSSKLAHDKNAILIFVGEKFDDDYGLEISLSIANSKFPEKIRITGWVDKATFRHYLAAADISVQLRSLSRGETSAAVLDCMNYGLATIVNSNGSMADLPEDGVWKMPDEFQDQDLVEALEKLWMQPGLRKQLGGKARETVLSIHSPHACAGKYSQFIESAYAKADSGPFGLVHALAKIEPYPRHNREYLSLAESVVSSIPARPSMRQLLVDISEIVVEDLKTGIQRVTRSVLRELLKNPPAGFRVEPVYYKNGGNYRYAVNYTLGFMGCPDIDIADNLAEFNPGDIFFVLDCGYSSVLNNQIFLNRLRHRGVQIQFLVHDILPTMMPKYFPNGMPKECHRWLQVFTENDGAICVSRAVAENVHDWLNFYGPQRQQPFKIGWSHNAANIEASSPSKGLPHDFKVVLKSLKEHPTFLMVGTVEPRKGHAQTVAAFEKLWSLGQEINLVIVGKEGCNVFEICKRLSTHPQLDRRLFWFKGISDEYLTQIYAASACLIAASEGEGFGLPLIEGAQHGLPIIARDISVFREVAGNHATYFKGSKPESIAESVLMWLDLYRTHSVPDTKNMPYLTWAESTRTLVNMLLDDKHPQWIHRWMPTESLPKAAAIEPDQIIRFDSKDIHWMGWSEPEKSHRWSLGRRSSIRFVLASDADWQGKLVIRIGTLGTQRIGVHLNGIDLGEESLALNDEKWIFSTGRAPIHVWEENELVLEFPDARQPGEGDPRILAIWVKEFIFM